MYFVQSTATSEVGGWSLNKARAGAIRESLRQREGRSNRCDKSRPTTFFVIFIHKLVTGNDHVPFHAAVFSSALTNFLGWWHIPLRSLLDIPDLLCCKQLSYSPHEHKLCNDRPEHQFDPCKIVPPFDSVEAHSDEQRSMHRQDTTPCHAEQGERQGL